MRQPLRGRSSQLKRNVRWTLRAQKNHNKIIEEKQKMEAIIGIVGIVLTIIFFFIGKKEGTREKHEDQINRQIDKIVERYYEWNIQNYDNGIHALSKLGLPILENDKNIREAIRRIELISGNNSLKTFKEITKGKDLFQIFSYIMKNEIDVPRTNIEKIINDLENENILKKKE
ncbi:MAG: hypothetical protein ACYC1E_16815 [Propionibacteriaceae bacterium]